MHGVGPDRTLGLRPPDRREAATYELFIPMDRFFRAKFAGTAARGWLDSLMAIFSHLPMLRGPRWRNWALRGVLLLLGCCGGLPARGDLPRPVDDQDRGIIARAFSLCADDPRGDTVVTVAVRNGQVDVLSEAALTPAVTSCVRASLQDFGLPAGFYVGAAISWSRPSGVAGPRFPHPIPRASDLREVTAKAVHRDGEPLKRLAERLGTALRSYPQLFWYEYLDGFVVLTTPQKIDTDGKPQCTAGQGCEQFATDFDQHIPWYEVPIRIFNRKSLRYRMFAFLVTTRPVRQEGPKSAPPLGPLPEGSGHVAPETISLVEDARDYHVHCAAYVYQRDEEGKPAALVGESISVVAQLRAAGIWDALEQQ